MPIKGNGMGSIFFNKQRKNWVAQHYEYDIQTGQVKKKSKSFKTQEEAKKYLSTIMYQKENPLYIEHHGIPLCEILKQNAKLKLEINQISRTQYSRILKTIEALEKTPFGEKNIDAITSNELQAYLISLKHLSNSMIEKAHQQLNQAFKIAINKGYIMKNPMINVIKPKSDKEDKIVRALTVEEQQNFTNWLLNKPVSEYKYRNVFLIQMYMGLRVGETLALNTHDIDLQNQKLNVHRTLTTDEKRKLYNGK